MSAEKEILDALAAVTRKTAEIARNMFVLTHALAALSDRVDSSFRDIHVHIKDVRSDILNIRADMTSGFREIHADMSAGVGETRK